MIRLPRRPKASPVERARRAISKALSTLQDAVGELPSAVHRAGYVSRLDGSTGYPETTGTWSLLCALDEAENAAAMFDGIRAASRLNYCPGPCKQPIARARPLAKGYDGVCQRCMDALGGP